MRNERILITGSSGFIGSYLLDKLSLNYEEVYGLDRKVKDETHFIRKIDVLDFQSLSDFVEDIQPDIVIHLAARTDLGIGDELEDFADNTDGVRNIVDIINNVGSVKRLVFTSTILVLPRGEEAYNTFTYDAQYPYGLSKQLGEEYIRDKSNVPWTILRPTSIWGPSCGGNYNKFFHRIKNGTYFNILRCNANITFGYLGNMAFQVEEILKFDKTQGKVYYIGDYTSVNLRYWSNFISENLGRGKVMELPWSCLKIVALIGDLISVFSPKINYPLNSYRLQNLTRDRVYSLNQIQELIPHLPYTLETASQETINWLNSRNEK